MRAHLSEVVGTMCILPILTIIAIWLHPRMHWMMVSGGSVPASEVVNPFRLIGRGMVAHHLRMLLSMMHLQR